MVRALLLVVVCISSVCVAGLIVSGDSISEKARKLHFSSIVVDTHDDTTQRFLDGKFDLGTRSATGSIDIPRMREGNLSAIFFSIWMPSKVTGPEAVDRALVQIDAVREQVRKHSTDMVLATTAAEVREARKEGKIAALMGVEGGHMINASLGVLRSYAALGVRYMTLTHSGNEEKGSPENNKALSAEEVERCGDNEGCQLIEGDRITREYVEQGKLPRVEFGKIIEHIDHAVKVAGVDHVGLGSDFDGANMPYGMEDATKLPKLTEALLQKGYSEGDVRKILGENTLRVMTEVERISRELSAGK